MKPLAALLCLWTLSGCMAPEDILIRLDAQDKEEINTHIQELTEMAGDSSEDLGLRCYAIKALSKFQSPDPQQISTLGENVTGSGSATVKSWSAHALGVLGDPSAIPYLAKALRSPIGLKAGYHVMEALARHYRNLIVDKKVQEEVLLALNAFSANQRETPPSLYYLLDQVLSNLEFCVSVLEKELQILAAPSADIRAKQNVYRALYKLIKYIGERNEQVVAQASEKRKLLEKAYQQMTGSLVRSQPVMSLLAVQGIGLYSERQALASLATPGVVKILRSNNRSVRLMSAWSLLRLQLHALEARTAFRQEVLGKETDSQTLELLADLYNQTDEFDAFQKLFNLDRDN